MRATALCLFFAASLCQAQTLQNTLLQRAGVEQARLVETAAGEVLLSVDGSTSGHAGVYRLTSSGNVEERLAVEIEPGSVFAHQRGFIATRSSSEGERHLEVVAYDLESARSDILYAAAPDTQQIHAVPAFADDAIYVVECGREPRSTLRRLGSTHVIEWEFQFADTSCAQLFAIPGGVVLQQPAEDGASNLLAISEAGAMLWQRPIINLRAATFVPPAHVALLRSDAAQGAWNSYLEPWQLAFMDARAGTPGVTMPVPSNTQLRSTNAGVLLAGTLLYQPYVTLLRPDGSRTWARRYGVDGLADSQLFDALVTRSGELLELVGALRGSALVVSATHFGGPDPIRWMPNPAAYVDGRLRDDHALTLLRTSATTPAATAACLEVDPTEVIELQWQLLSVYGVQVGRGQRAADADATGNRTSCPPVTDPQFLQFLRELAANLDPQPLPRKLVGVSVGRHADPYRRAQYGVRYFGAGILCRWPSPPASFVSYEVDVAAGAEFAAHLRTQIQPHLQRLSRLLEGLQQLTGDEFGVPARAAALSDTLLFQRLEATASTALSELQTLPAARRHASPAQRSIAITEYGLVPASEDRPHANIGTILRELYPPPSTRSR